jgi:hypothetical protein
MTAPQRTTAPFLAVQIVPTGVGAAVGGYAGDATPATNALAAVADVVLAHPNVLNAATLFAPAPNVAYVDGGLLDRFLAGDIALMPVHRHRIGLIVDRRAESDLPMVLSAAGATRAVGGVTLSGWTLTDAPLDLTITLQEGDCSSGSLGNPDVLLAAGQRLIDAGATALAVAARLPDLPEAAVARYEAGEGPDPIGGLEAVISRALTLAFQVPCAHAPIEAEPWSPPAQPSDPRVAAETISPSYLPCILLGLARAPRPVPPGTPGAWHADQVGAVLTAAGCTGGPGVLAALAAGIPVLEVTENQTRQTLTLAHPALVPTGNYWEAIGFVAALRAGLDPATLRRPLLPVPRV